MGVILVDFMCGDSQSEWCKEWGIAALSPSSELWIGYIVKHWEFGCVGISECAVTRLYLSA